MTKAQKTKWLKALRSGEYKQGRDLLHNEDNDTYCCLGVARACGLTRARKGGKEFVSLSFLNEAAQVTLAHMNDNYGGSFAAIADYIEKNL